MNYRRLLFRVVPAGCVGTYKLISGSVYSLRKFFESRSKVNYRVADHIATFSFSLNSELSVIKNPPVRIDEDRFRFHSYAEFQTNCDSRGDIYGKICLNGDGVYRYIFML